jgi:ribosome-binding factor A
MSRNIEQVNSLLQKELAEIINKEIMLNNCLVTISYVDCSPDLNYAKIAVSVLPDKFIGSAMEAIKKHTGRISAALQKKIKLRTIPRFNWVIDDTEKHAAVIDGILRQIEAEKNQ